MPPSLKRLIPHVSVLCLVLLSLFVLAHHFYRVHSYGLSMWKGGGMGMFTTQDTPGSRAVAITLFSGETPYLARHDGLGSILSHYLAEPTKENLVNLCRAVVARSWVHSGHGRVQSSAENEAISLPLLEVAKDLSSKAPVSLSAVELTGWKVAVEVSSGAVTRQPLGRAYYQRDVHDCHVIF